MRRPRRPPFAGLLLGLVFFGASLTPSLVPRGWLLQGVVTGIAATIGYGLGVLASHLVRQGLPLEPPSRVKRLAWRILVATLVVGSVVLVLLSGRWQRQLHLLMGAEEPSQPAYLAVLGVAGALLVALVATGRGLRLAARAVGLRLRRWVPPRTAALTGTALVALVVAGLVQGVLVPGLLSAADESFRAVNETVADELPSPRSPRVSGGPGSLVAWDELGRQGRRFVRGTSSTRELRTFLARRGIIERPVAEPVRVYAGLETAEEVDERARLALAELERTGAFERSVLCVAHATGTGWLDPTAMTALEHLYAGDTAIASIQYSYLPSWLSFLVDRERATEAGRALFDAVHEHWASLPAGERPRLVVFGESLGSYAAESAFEDLDDLTDRTDGALLVGPPAANPLRRSLLDARDPGTPERLPVVDGGRTVRFAARPRDLWEPGGAWPPPRVVYLQHASDPVVWWSPGLAVRRPDWLGEPRGADVIRDMRWFPLVTFWQLSADLAVADEVPPGRGHDYGTQVVDAWHAVLDPPWIGEADLRWLRDRLGAPGDG